MCNDVLTSVSLSQDLVAQTYFFPHFIRHWLSQFRKLSLAQLPIILTGPGLFFWESTTFLNSLGSPGLHSFLSAAVNTIFTENSAAQRILSNLKQHLATDQ